MLIFGTITVVILLLYILVYFILKRKLHIEEKRLHPFSKNKNKSFFIVEIIAIIAFAVIGIVYFNITGAIHFSPHFIPQLTFSFFK